MKVLLIGINSKYIHPALAIYQLKENLNLDNVECITAEFTIKDDYLKIVNYINSLEVDLVCFSVYIWNVSLVNKILNYYKNTSHYFHICLGGPEVSFEYDHYLLNKLCNYIIRGEGEIPFRILIDSLIKNNDLTKVPNLSYTCNQEIVRNNEQLFNLNDIKLATLCVPDYKNRIVYLEASRGCPFKCSYCLASTSNSVRFFPIDTIKNILKTLIDVEVKEVKFLDRTFNARPEYTKEIISYINSINTKTSFQFEIVVDKLTDELLDLIKASSNFPIRFEIGIQTMNEHVNKAINRYQNNELLIKNINILNNLPNVDLHLDLIAGLPYETLDEFIKSFNTVFKLNAKELQLGFLKCLKGTLISKQQELHQYQFDKNSPYQIIENKYLSNCCLNEIHLVEESLDLFYNSNRFKNTFNYLIKNYNINFYQFFLDLSNYLINMNFNFHLYQLYDLFLNLYNFLLKFHDDNLLFLVKKDYLLNNKTKPKKWWPGLNFSNLENKNKILINLVGKNIDDIYRYSVIINNGNHYFIIFYQNFAPTFFEFDV